MNSEMHKNTETEEHNSQISDRAFHHIVSKMKSRPPPKPRASVSEMRVHTEYFDGKGSASQNTMLNGPQPWKFSL